MMSGQLIKNISDHAAYRAAQEGNEPLVIWDAERDVRAIPFLGSYVPQGWREATWDEVPAPRNIYSPHEGDYAYFMVDASGFGSRSEPALTFSELVAYVEEVHAANRAAIGWALVEQGQFQAVVGIFIKDDQAEGTPAPEIDPCEYCGEVHDDLTECDRDLIALCLDCGDPIDYCLDHASALPIIELHDDDDHSQCHPDACEESTRDDGQEPQQAPGQEELFA